MRGKDQLKEDRVMIELHSEGHFELTGVTCRTANFMVIIVVNRSGGVTRDTKGSCINASVRARAAFISRVSNRTH